MTVTTVRDRVQQEHGDGRHTPRVELDLPTALSTIHAADRRLVPDARGGTVLDLARPVMAPLLPYLGATGTWALLADARAIEPARRAIRVADAVVLDARSGRPGSGRHSDADLVVLPVDEVEPTRERPPGPAALVDLTELPRWRIGSDLFTAGGVAGLHVELPAPADPAAEERATGTIVCALRRWDDAGRPDRPLLLIRGTGTPTAGRVIGAVLQACRADALPTPVLRVEMSATVLDVAVRTVVRVLAVSNRGDRPLLHLDGLPAAVDPSLRVLRPRSGPAAPERVLITANGRLRTARLHGGPVVPGSELDASGWIDTVHPVVVRSFAAG
jgi:hypothetical protein